MYFWYSLSAIFTGLAVIYVIFVMGLGAFSLSLAGQYMCLFYLLTGIAAPLGFVRNILFEEAEKGACDNKFADVWSLMHVLVNAAISLMFYVMWQNYVFSIALVVVINLALEIIEYFLYKVFPEIGCEGLLNRFVGDIFFDFLGSLVVLFF